MAARTVLVLGGGVGGLVAVRELRHKLEPSLGALIHVGREGHAPPLLPDQLSVRTLVAGRGEADLNLILQILTTPEKLETDRENQNRRYAALVRGMVTQQLLSVVADATGPHYSRGPAGLGVLGDDGVEPLCRVAWVANVANDGAATSITGELVG